MGLAKLGFVASLFVTCHTGICQAQGRTGNGAAVEPAAASPITVEPLIAGSRDSDGDAMIRVGLALDGPAGRRGRLGVIATRGEVADGIDRVRVNELQVRGSYRAGRHTDLDGSIGGSALDLSGPAPTQTVVPTGMLHARWRGSPGTKVDLRARRAVIDGSPTLVASRVIREEVSGTLDVRLVGPLGVRGVGRVAGIASRFDRNTRAEAAGMVVVAISPELELSGQLHQLGYAHATTAGYFAPRVVQSVQIGSYGEFERDRIWLALDARLGVQRLADQGTTTLTGWKRAYGLWSMISYALGGGASIRLELEAYDAPAATIAATSAGWRYGSASVSLRWRVG